MIVTAFNPSLDNLQKSYLSNSYAAGATSLVVRDANGFAANDFILLGDMGNEKSEVVQVSAVNADKITLTISATKFPHSSDDPVYVLKYNQIKFYRSTTTIDGSYTEQAAVDISVDAPETNYDDATGLSSYFYKISYYNSETTVESSFSDPIPGSGYTRKQVGAILNDFFTEVGDREQTYMSVPQALSVMNEVNDDLTSQSSKPYRFLRASTTLTITANEDRIALPDDVLAFDRATYNAVDGITNRTDIINVVDIEEMEYIKYDNSAATSDALDSIALDETTNELVLYPTPKTTQADKITLYYWKKFSDFDSLGDTIETPTPRIYKLFLAGRFYRNRGLHDQSFLPLSDRYASDYNSEVVKLQRLNRVDKGTSRGMRPDVRRSRGLAR
ncbi:MAG TPA: hypothetical protein VFL85_01485 [Candidatus Saccharimonadales bacterium]|nr:hypothetical protein [Candidatus Saccharimonadales bacterium]